MRETVQGSLENLQDKNLQSADAQVHVMGLIALQVERVADSLERLEAQAIAGRDALDALAHNER